MFPLKTTVFSRNPPITTWLIIGLNVALFFIELQLPRESLERLTYLFGVVPARYTNPDWAAQVGYPTGHYWPYLTSMFLHGGVMHILGNMWTLWVFGMHVEDRMGPVRYLMFYLLCGIGAGIVHTFVNPDSTVPAIGASGAIAGIMGAYLVMFPLSRVIVMVPIFFYPLFFDFQAVFYLGYWFLLQLLSGAFSLIQSPAKGGIAFWAHVGGFLFGVLLLPMFLRPKSQRRVPYHDEGNVRHAWNKEHALWEM